MSTPKRKTPDLTSLGSPSPLVSQQQLDEYNTGAFGTGILTFLGSKAKPVLGLIALRATPLPTEARVALGGGVAAAALGAWLLRRHD